MKFKKLHCLVFLCALASGICHANSLQDMHERSVAQARLNLQKISLPVQERAVEYWILAQGLDSLGNHADAIVAAQKALDADPDNRDFRITNAKILRQLGEVEKGLSVIRPITEKLREATSKSRSLQEASILVLGDQAEAFLAEMHLYAAAGQWDKAIDSLSYAHDVRGAKSFYPYRALWYLVLKAKGGKSVGSIEGSIPPSSKLDNHYGKLIRYWLNQGSFSEASESIEKIAVPRELQDARAEGLFFLAMKEKLINKNDAAYGEAVQSLGKLSPYGNTEWSLLETLGK